MHIWLHKLEKLVDRAIAPLLVLLFILIIGEIFFGERFEPYSLYADYFDIFLILVFAADLAFKFNRVRKVPKFIRSYWLEIIATIPFFLIFRFTEFFGLQAFIERGQEVVHEMPEVQKLERETSAIVREAGKASRTARIIRSLRIVARFPRFLKVLPFHEKPTGRHHWYEKRLIRSKKYKAA